MHISATAVAALFVRLFLVNGPSQAQAAQCETANSFADFARIVNLGMTQQRAEICFRPFHLAKPTGGTLVLNRPMSLRCEKLQSNDKCTLEGGGNHITIAGGNAKVTIDGFSFTGATQAAVHVMQTSRETHSLSGCEFIKNRASMIGWRGGAIMTEVGTALTISQCTFTANEAAAGGAIFHNGDELKVSKSKFSNNVAKAGGAIAVESSPSTELSECDFLQNRASGSNTGAIEVFQSVLTMSNSVSGSGNSPCDGVYDRSSSLCRKWQSYVISAFDLGQITVNSLGLRLSTGLSVKILARAGEPVSFTSPERKRTNSLLKFHTNPDAAAVFPLKDGGWIYISNSENESRKGGVFGVEFDSNGSIRDYVERLSGTTRNCSGGKTPWNSWVSCEEYGQGSCWQVDPTGVRPPVVTKLVEGGGSFEAMAYDIRDLQSPKFFVTEDQERGAIRRFRPTCNSLGLSWNLIQVNGEIDYLQFTGDNTFQWTSSIEEGRNSAEQYYRNVEGISFHNGILSFVSKVQKEIFNLKLDAGTYTTDTTQRGLLTGGGNFEAEPDQLIRVGEMLYFTEDGGISPGIFASDGIEYFTVFLANDKKFANDETTGLAFSPDGTKMYVCLQEIGFFFEITRDDGLAFPGHKVSKLKFSSAADSGQ